MQTLEAIIDLATQPSIKNDTSDIGLWYLLCILADVTIIDKKWFIIIGIIVIECVTMNKRSLNFLY